MKNPSTPATSSLATRVFLVVLRLAIGWHLFIEGASKLETFSTGPTGTTKPFSSRGYLQQSQGPLGPYFRKMAGDPDQLLQARLTIQSGTVPETLTAEWTDYLRRYSDHYQLDATQKNKAQELLAQHLKKLGEWFQSGTRTVTREYSFTSITPTLSTSARIKEYRDKLKELHDKIDAWNMRFDKDVTKSKITTLRGEIARLRGELQKDLDDQQEKLGLELDKLLTPDQAQGDYLKYQARLTNASKTQGYTADHQALAELVQAARDAKNAKVSPEVWTKEEREPVEVIAAYSTDPEYRKVLLKISKRQVGPPLHVEDTWMLDTSDRIVAWGLTIFGMGLLLGCFTRLSCLGGACLLLLFYISLPPLPGLPDNPMAEGKYLFVNKNLIEAIALLALATTASGRWFGIDGLLSNFAPFKYCWPRSYRTQDSAFST